MYYERATAYGFKYTFNGWAVVFGLKLALNIHRGCCTRNGCQGQKEMIEAVVGLTRSRTERPISFSALSGKFTVSGTNAETAIDAVGDAVLLRGASSVQQKMMMQTVQTRYASPQHAFVVYLFKAFCARWRGDRTASNGAMPCDIVNFERSTLNNLFVV